MSVVASDFVQSELVLLSAPDEDSLATAATIVADFLEQAPDAQLSDVAFTCSRTEGPVRAAIVAQSTDDLRSRLRLVASRVSAGASRIRDKSGTYYNSRGSRGEPGKVAFVFPGSFAFYPDMLRDLAVFFPECRGAFDELEEALGGTGKFSPFSFVFPPAPCYRHDADVFSAGGYAEAMVSVYSASLALVRLFSTAGITPDGLIGFSGGDLAALSASGAFGAFARSQRLDFLRDMYQLAKKTVSGMPNPGSLSPDPEWCGKFKSDFRKFAKRWLKKPVAVPVYSCTTAAPLSLKPRKACDEAAVLWTEPLRFDDTVKRMHEDGYRIFVEVGPRSVLSASVREVLRGEDYVAISANTIHRSSVVQFQHALAQLAALGLPVDLAPLFRGRRTRRLDFSSPLSVEVRADSSMTLRRDFPRLVNISFESLAVQKVSASPAAPGARARSRAAAAAARERLQRQLDLGTRLPLVGDADRRECILGKKLVLAKTFSIDEIPLFAASALSASNISYSDRRLHGYTPLSLAFAGEIMAETAAQLVPNHHLLAVDDLQSGRVVGFSEGRLSLIIRAWREDSGDPSKALVKASVSLDVPDSDGAKSFAEAVFTFTDKPTPPTACVPPVLQRPRSVHWSGSDIYPDRLYVGELLQHIVKADSWSEVGINYEVEVPSSSGTVSHTKFPVWILNPQLIAVVASGFDLWRSHERFEGSFAIAFRIRHLAVHSSAFHEHTVLKCYLRLVGGTETTQLADIVVSDGSGQQLLAIGGLEELSERVPAEYCRLVLSPATAYLTQELSADTFGSPSTNIATAWMFHPPYRIFERNEELWLKTVSDIVLHAGERKAFREMPGTVQRRTEWLFGRIAAKEAIRRFLNQNYQARWNSADVQIWQDDQGKPRALGTWGDFLSSRIDIAIAHTRDAIVAVAAANARAGVDVESASRDLSEEFTNGAFSADEQELAASNIESASALIRFWCAKEAVSKALGTGIRYSPRDLVVDAFDPATGDLSVSLTGPWLDAFKVFRGRPVRVSSKIVESHVLASCFIPETYFN